MVTSRSTESRRASGWGLLRTAAFVLGALTVAGGLLAAESRSEQPRIAASAMVQIEALQSIKRSTTGIQQKIDSRLYLGLLHQRGDARLSPLKDFRFVRPESDNRIPVDLQLHDAGGVKPVLNELKALGGVMLARSYSYLRIRARVRLEDLETLAAMPEIKRVRQAIPSFTHRVNTSEGDRTHGAFQARNFYGSNGTGVKVGVISDGVDSLASVEASGDLPTSTQVLPGQAGSGDEGTAMLEIVHDLAPGADLVFSPRQIPIRRPSRRTSWTLAAAGCNSHRRRHHLSRRVALRRRGRCAGRQHGHGRRSRLLLLRGQRRQQGRRDLGHLGRRLHGQRHASRGRRRRCPRLRRRRPVDPGALGQCKPGGAHLGRALHPERRLRLDRLRPLRHGR